MLKKLLRIIIKKLRKDCSLITLIYSTYLFLQLSGLYPTGIF